MNLGQIRYNERLVRYRYLHCRMRLQHRYNIEMSEEEYGSLCEDFRLGRVRNSWKTDAGAIEAWVMFKGIIVCAHFRPAEGLITTFQKPPELEPEVPKPVAEFLDEHTIIKGLRERVVSLEAKIRTLNSALIREQKKATPNSATRTAKWFKAQAQLVAPLIKSGRLLEGLARIQALGSLPRDFTVSDTNVSNAILAEHVEYQLKQLNTLYEEVKK